MEQKRTTLSEENINTLERMGKRMDKEIAMISKSLDKKVASLIEKYSKNLIEETTSLKNENRQLKEKFEGLTKRMEAEIASLRDRSSLSSSEREKILEEKIASLEEIIDWKVCARYVTCYIYSPNNFHFQGYPEER